MRCPRWIALLVTMVLVMVAPLSQAHAEEPTPEPAPQAVLNLGVGDIPDGKVGEDVEITFPLINVGEVAATNVIVTPKPSVAAEHFPFEITSTNYSVKVDKPVEPQGERPVADAQVDVKLGTFTVREGLASGYYAMPIGIQYTVEGSQKVIERALFIKIEGVEQPAPEAPKPITVEVPKYIEVPMAGGGMPGGGFDVPSYVPGGGAGLGGDSAGGSGAPSMPRVMLTWFATNPPQVIAGQEFTIDFTVQNMSSAKRVSNIKVTITSAEASLLPVNGASSVYIDSLGANEASSQRLKFSALPNLDERPYQLGMQIEYESDGAPGQAMETLAVPVTQKARADFTTFQVAPTSIEEGEEASVSFSINNRGKSRLYNTTVRLAKSDAFEAQDVFLGTIEPGSSSPADLLVRGLKPTDGPVKIEIVYEDAFGKESVITKEAELAVTPMGSNDGTNGEGDEAASGPNWGALLWPLLALAIIAAIVVIVIVSRKRKEKKQREADEAMALDSPQARGPQPGAGRS